MKKKFISAFVAITLSLSLIACSSASKKAEISNDSTKKEDSAAKKEDKPKTDASTATSSDSSNKDDIWTYYNGTQWSDNFDGLNLQIEKVVLSDKAPSIDNADKKESAAGVKFKLTNTTKDKFTTYPDQAVLVTSTGEQIDMPNMLISDHLGGEIDEGVTKEGNIIWYLKNTGTAKDITWVKLSWNAHKGAEDNLDNPTKKYEVKLELKK